MPTDHLSHSKNKRNSDKLKFKGLFSNCKRTENAVNKLKSSKQQALSERKVMQGCSIQAKRRDRGKLEQMFNGNSGADVID